MSRRERRVARPARISPATLLAGWMVDDQRKGPDTCPRKPLTVAQDRVTRQRRDLHQNRVFPHGPHPGTGLREQVGVLCSARPEDAVCSHRTQPVCPSFPSSKHLPTTHDQSEVLRSTRVLEARSENRARLRRRQGHAANSQLGGAPVVPWARHGRFRSRLLGAMCKWRSERNLENLLKTRKICDILYTVVGNG